MIDVEAGTSGAITRVAMEAVAAKRTSIAKSARTLPALCLMKFKARFLRHTLGAPLAYPPHAGVSPRSMGVLSSILTHVKE